MRLVSLLLASAIAMTSIPLPSSAEMLTPETYRAKIIKEYKLDMEGAQRAIEAKNWERAKNFLYDAEHKTTSRDEDLLVQAGLAFAFKGLGDDHVANGGEYDNMYYRDALSAVNAALEFAPENPHLLQLKGDIPVFKSRREQAEAKERWRREDEARRAIKRKQEEEEAAKIPTSTKAAATFLGVAAIALSTKALLSLGANALAKDGTPAFGGTVSGATGDDEFQCELRCVAPARVVVFSVLAHDQTEAVHIAGYHSVEVCHIQGGGSSTPYLLEYDKCHRR